MNNKICPLCWSENTFLFQKDKKRSYYKCNICHLIYVPSIYHLSPSDEKKRYDQHENSILDNKYIDFLQRIVMPIKELIPPTSSGLDFGCGPSPVLKKLFIKNNINIFEYDIYYNNNEKLLMKNWDFVVTTEVVEHLSDPISVFNKLWNIINDNGILAIMTNLYSKEIEFNSWYYKGDPTHIMFYSKETFIWLAMHLNAKVEFFDKDITILKKK